MSVYVCSDIHGQYSLYKEMLDVIHFSDNDELYILGDMIDRGPDNVGILRDVATRDNIHCLMGNHELMMYDYFHRGRTGEYWFGWSNGGRQTYRELMKLSEDERDSILRLVDDLYLQVELDLNGKTYLLSHSSFWIDKQTIRMSEAVNDPNVFSGAIQDLVWDSPWREFEYAPLESYAMDNREHIIGHVPVQHIAPAVWPDRVMPEMPMPMIDKENHLINIDLGCAAIPGTLEEYKRGAMTLQEIRALGYSLCVMDLTGYATGKEDAFAFIMPQYEK